MHINNKDRSEIFFWEKNSGKIVKITSIYLEKNVVLKFFYTKKPKKKFYCLFTKKHVFGNKNVFFVFRLKKRIFLRPWLTSPPTPTHHFLKKTEKYFIETIFGATTPPPNNSLP